MAGLFQLVKALFEQYLSDALDQTVSAVGLINRGANLGSGAFLRLSGG